MKLCYLLASGIFLAVLANAGVSVPAQAKTMKECAAEWQQLKADKKTNGMKYRDFSKQCMAGNDTSGSPPTTTTPTPPKKPSGGREAMYARERACAAEWKELKAQNKVPAGMKWPKFWSECDKRKKAEGM